MFIMVILQALLRSTFLFNLIWRSTGEQFTVVHNENIDTIEDEFRFYDTQEWMILKATAANSNNDCPLVSLQISIPISALTCDQALRSANDINKRSNVSVYYDKCNNSMVIHGYVVYTGYAERPPEDVEPGVGRAQNEAAVNMALAVFSAAGIALESIRHLQANANSN